jgi:hypothetical protein
MSDAEKFETFDVLPDRLSVAEFSPEHIDRLLGPTLESQNLARENFNWTAAYLVEEVGLYEREVAEWFLSAAKGLDGRTPLEAWDEPEGFNEVFDYARTYAEQVNEAMEEAGIPRNDSRERSHEIARQALGIIIPSLVQVIGDYQTAENHALGFRRIVWNPEKRDRLFVSWKGDGRMEDYRVTTKEDEGQSTYYIVRAFPPDAPPMILQTGIVRTFRGESDIYGPSTSDLDGRPPSASEVASFVIPVANEMKNRSLELMPA